MNQKIPKIIFIILILFNSYIFCMDFNPDNLMFDPNTENNQSPLIEYVNSIQNNSNNNSLSTSTTEIENKSLNSKKRKFDQVEDTDGETESDTSSDIETEPDTSNDSDNETESKKDKEEKIDTS